MAEEKLRQELEKYGFSDEAQNAIIDWQDDDLGKREEIYEKMRALDFRRLGDLRQAIKTESGTSWNTDGYWPRYYINRIATHYYDIKSSDAAKESATAARNSAATAENALEEAKAATHTGKTSLKVSIGALMVTTVAVVINLVVPYVFTPEQEVNLKYDTKQLVGIIDEQWSERENALIARLVALEVKLEDLDSRRSLETDESEPTE